MGAFEIMTPFERRKAEVLERIYGPEAPKGSSRILRLRMFLAYLIQILNIACFFPLLIAFSLLLIIGVFHGGYAWIQDIIATKNLLILFDLMPNGWFFVLGLFSWAFGGNLGLWITPWIVTEARILSKDQYSEFEFRLARRGIFGIFVKNCKREELTRHPFKN